MKILSITAQKPHSTGSGTYLTELVRAFARGGHEQAVVCGIFPDDDAEFPEGVTVYPVFFSSRSGSVKSPADASLFCKCKTPGSPLSPLPFPVVGMSDIMPYESTLYRNMTPSMVSSFEEAFIDAVSRAVTDLDPDVIICHHLFLLTALVRKHFPDRCIYGISHGTDLRQMQNCDNLRDTVRPEIARLNRIFALHEEQRERISEIFGVDRDKVQVIGSGYNSDLFNSGGRHSRSELSWIAGGIEVPVMICYAGKMSRPKGVPELLRALKTLNDEDDLPPFEVTLAGGCRDAAVMDLLETLPDNIRWIGQIPQERLAEIFRFSDVFVLPSYFEGLPLVLIEAMASGMIPVSSDLPGVRKWIEDNVPLSNVRFIDMPEMATIDTPTEAGREKFVADLTGTLRDVIRYVASDPSAEPPVTDGITWDSVARRIISG